VKVQKLWDDLDLVKKFSTRKGDKFWLLDGPPYPNAEPHLGHVRGVTIKDLILKIKAMQGYGVWIKPGFDTHGLPIENKVEKELGIRTKDGIEKMGVSEFMERCREFATSNIDVWTRFYRDMGVWFGWEKPYMTLNLEYMDSVWWSVSELWKKGLLKMGKKPFYWCPHCQTVLSGYEVTDEYHELEDPSIFVKFPTGKGFSLLAWTTTPWTLPGNTALVVRGDADYVKVDACGEKLVLAEKTLGSLESLGVKYNVVDRFKGKELDGMKYLPVIDCAAQHSIDGSGTARRVYLSLPVIKQKVAGKVAAKKEVEGGTLVEHFTNLEEGTGIVHSAPGHGPADFEIGRHYDMEVLSPVDDKGCFTGDVEPFAGQGVRESNFGIAEYLKEHGLLLGMEKIHHRYPVCWRCRTPLIFRMTEQWSLDIKQLKKKLIRAAKKVKWLPGFAEERMINWLTNAEDWTLSRQRYWNTPLPIWTCPNGHIKVVSGADELSRLSGHTIKDLHRDVVDHVSFSCPECRRSKMQRVPDVLDVWYDSGAASFAVPGYPRDKARFTAVWPIDWIDEGQDQIRGWFYTLLILGVALFDESPYKCVSMHGWVVDEKGEKMSKSKGNVISARQAMEMLGPDILRFYIIWESSPWDLVRFSEQRAKKEIGKMFHIWKNLHSYLMKFSKGMPEKGKLMIEDKWVLSKYNSMVKGFLADLEKYNLHHATRGIYRFIVEDLSRKYMKLAKDRVRGGDQTPLWVLKQVHHGLLRLVAPISPIFVEETYQDYVSKFSGEKSVFLESYPEPDKTLIDEKTEKLVNDAFRVVETILMARDTEKRGLKYPIRSITVGGFDFRPVEGIIKFLANVKKIKQGRDPNKGVPGASGNIAIGTDWEMGEEELQEGLMREASRRVRSLRRKKKLNLTDVVEIHVWGDDRVMAAVKALEKEFIHRIGASALKYSKGGELQEEWNFKGIKFGAGL
jgi:isoleucyl-tRNA synthetase